MISQCRHFVVVASMFATSFVARADDWPQWLGPQRDGVWRETGLVDSFPKEGPTVIWRAKIAGGYAGPAVSDGRAYVADYVTDGDTKKEVFTRTDFKGQERIHREEAACGFVKICTVRD